ncbi:MAG: 2-amino-4-hydroxy-6-hydroxymethyldihydropteridine diphosphokinase [Myxococcota bacterium]|nr:2-amino-4-hydroxy-6-hydroxymethyldihydropteridine diphosphokinase [Myxococcota bacterium]
MESAWIALGSNLGNREQQLSAAIDALARVPHVQVVATSRVYQTEPIGPPPQGLYLNAVAELAVEMTARGLLAVLQTVERAGGRLREAEKRWMPRTLDLDLLLFGEQRIDEPDLVVPHPRMHERAFVLVPLAELARDLRHPVLGRTVGELASAFEDLEDVRLHSMEPLEGVQWPSQQ